MKRANIGPGMRLTATLIALLASTALAFAPSSAPGKHMAAYQPTALSSHDPAISRQATAAFPQAAVADAAPLSTRSTGSIFFQQTGHFVKDAFLNYWLMNGSSGAYGYPVSEEFVQDGVSVQYFQKARFEYRPDSSQPWKVVLSATGSLLTADRSFTPATQDSTPPDRTFYSETRHTLGGAFGKYWQDNGGLALFGFPISEEMQENGTTVQYFERARLEMSPSGKVQAANVGSELLQKALAAGVDPSQAQTRARPGFNMNFWGEATWFHADWNRVISLNKGWGNLPNDFVGRGIYAAAPADLNLYGRWARVSKGNRSIFVQFVDVINWPDIPYVRNKGIVIDLGEETYRLLGNDDGNRYEVTVDVFWPGQEP